MNNIIWLLRFSAQARGALSASVLARIDAGRACLGNCHNCAVEVGRNRLVAKHGHAVDVGGHWCGCGASAAESNSAVCRAVPRTFGGISSAR